jgi:YaeC family lipoprotein
MARVDKHFEIKKKNRFLRAISVVVILVIATGAFFYFKSNRSDAVVFGDTLKVHFELTNAGEEKVIEYISEHIAPDYGIKLEAVGLQDPVQSDRAVAEGVYAATIYQHQWWLKQVVDANGFELTPVFPIFQWGFGIYSDRYKSVKELPDGAVIAVPIDGANQGQALWLLEKEGFIGLNKNIEPRVAKIRDIVSNPRNFQLKELDLLTLPRVLDSVDIAVGYISHFDAGKIPREKGILFPPPPKTFASQLVIGTKFLNDPQIIKLQKAFADPRLKKYFETTDDPLVHGVLTPVSAD